MPPRGGLLPRMNYCTARLKSENPDRDIKGSIFEAWSRADYWAIQARLLTPLTFARHRFKSLGCFYFRCVLFSQWKAVTANLRILH